MLLNGMTKNEQTDRYSIFMRQRFQPKHVTLSPKEFLFVSKFCPIAMIFKTEAADAYGNEKMIILLNFVWTSE